MKKSGNLKEFLRISASVLLISSSAFAQVGSGPAPPATASPDKFPNITWTQSASCVPASTCSNNVYRGIVAGGLKGRINAAPVTTQPYRDTTASFEVQNFYTVTAVRTSNGVESAQSTEVSATAVQGSPASPTGVNIVVAVLIKIGKGVIYAITFGRINLFS